MYYLTIIISFISVVLGAILGIFIFLGFKSKPKTNADQTKEYYKNDSDKLKKENIELKNQLAKLHDENIRLEGELIKFKDESIEFKINYNNLKKINDVQPKNINCKKQNIEISSLKNEIDVLENDLEDLEDEISELKKRNINLKNINNELDENLYNVEKEKKEILKIKLEKEKKLENLQTENKKQNDNLDFINDILNANDAIDEKFENVGIKTSEIISFIENDLKNSLHCFNNYLIDEKFLKECWNWRNQEIKTWIKNKKVVAIVGEFSSGKTSIVNRILKQDDTNAIELPVKSTETTAIPTYISKGIDFNCQFEGVN